MVQIDQISAADFDWSAEDGPAAEVRRIARGLRPPTTAPPPSTSRRCLQLKNRGLRDADLWLGGGGFALRHGDILDLAVHPESRRQGVGTALAAAALPAGRKVEAWSHADHPGAAALAERFGIPRERELKIMRRSLLDALGPVHGARRASRSAASSRATRRRCSRSTRSAFAHHPEQGHMTHEDFRERTSESWFDPAGPAARRTRRRRRPAPARLPLDQGAHATRTRRTARSTSSRSTPRPPAAASAPCSPSPACSTCKDQGLDVGAALRRRRQRPRHRGLHRPGLRRRAHRGAVPRHLQRRPG